jgi:hypothetical protein
MAAISTGAAEAERPSSKQHNNKLEHSSMNAACNE